MAEQLGMGGRGDCMVWYNSGKVAQRSLRASVRTMEALNEKLIKLKNNNAQLIKLNVENIGCETTCCLVHYVHTH